MEIHHFSHDHPLIFSEEKHNTEFPCGICGETIFGVSYCCKTCPYILHKWCSDLPLELPSHKRHLPDHPLILTSRNPSRPSTLENCKICRKEIKYPASVYTCKAKECSSFRLHVECASLERINCEFLNIDTKATSTLYFTRKYQEGCECVLCGYNCFGPLFYTLDLGNTRYLHVHCAMLPHRVKHERHLHDLTLHPPLIEDENYSELFCYTCEEERDRGGPIYYCDHCDMVAHIGCGITGDERPPYDILGTCSVYELFKGLKHDEISELMEREEEGETYEDNKGILHFTHEHPLVLFNYKKPTYKRCNGCFRFVFGKTYSCKYCDWHLHKWCAHLPEEIQHSMHPGHGSLKLITNLVHADDEKVTDSSCAVCLSSIGTLLLGSGFFYKCLECNILMHGLCAMLPKNLTHQSHKHPLVIEKVGGSSTKPLCQACKFPCYKFVSLSCESCNFYLHMQCFLLPQTGKHISHMHNLNLTYSYKEDPRDIEYFCDTCEKRRIPNRWVYCCPNPKCCILGDTDCVIRNPFVVPEIKAEDDAFL